MTMGNSKITLQSVHNGKVLAKNIPHPFNCYLSTTRLNPDAFDTIEGEEVHEEYSWDRDGDNFEVDVDIGSAADIHTGNVYLCVNNDSITVVLFDICKGYRYPKEYFSLIKSPQFEFRVKQLELQDKLFALEKRNYPKEVFNSIKKAIIETHKNQTEKEVY